MRPGGNPDLKSVRNKNTAAANRKRRDLADEYSRETGKLLYQASLEQQGMNLVEYAEWLNRRRWPTRRGGQWTATQVARVFKRMGLSQRRRAEGAVRQRVSR